MATATSTKAERTVRTRAGSTSPRRRAVKKAPTRVMKRMVPVEEIGPEDVAPQTRRARQVGRQTLKPLKEVYFVGLGLVDWAMEQLWVAERNLAERGQRRNEALGQMASEMGATVSSGAASIYRGAREEIGSLGERLGDKVCEGASRLSARGSARAGRRMRMPEEEAVPMAQPV